MDARGRRRIYITALILFVSIGIVTWTVTLTSGCPQDGCAPIDWPTVVANLVWIVPALIALALVATGRAEGSARRPAGAGRDPGAVAPVSVRRGDGGAGDRDPQARLDRFLASLDRASIDEARVLAVRPLDRAAHDEARATALEAATGAGRGELVAASRHQVVRWVEGAFAANAYDPTFIGLAWRHEPLRPEDRLLLAETLADAALGLIVLDLVADSVADELIGPCAVLAGTEDVPVPGEALPSASLG
jgi:hypothetical protein